MPMEHGSYPCIETYPLNRTMVLIGGKWKIQVLYSLYSSDPARYNQLRKILDGVSSTVLTNALRELGRDGLIHRWEHLEALIRVEYAVTEPCRQPISILDALGDWSVTLQA